MLWPADVFWGTVFPGWVGAVGTVAAAIIAVIAIVKGQRAQSGVQQVAASLNATPTSSLASGAAAAAPSSNEELEEVPETEPGDALGARALSFVFTEIRPAPGGGYTATLPPVTWDVERTSGTRWKVTNRAPTSVTITGWTQADGRNDIALENETPFDVAAGGSFVAIARQTFSRPSTMAVDLAWERSDVKVAEHRTIYFS